MEDRLVGFDMREPDRAELWDAARRERFLLRVDAPLPLSVDTLVWPSAFDTGQGIGLPQPERERWRLAGIPVPSWIGPNAGLWDDLGRMRQHLAAHQGQPRAYVEVAVSWFSDDGFTDAGVVGPYLAPVTPPLRGVGWRLLGYDVADGSLVSGLANCGYSPTEAAGLRQEWRARLNDHHLFSDVRQALQFKQLSDRRIPEHAPFFVYGLFTVEETGSVTTQNPRPCTSLPQDKPRPRRFQ